MNEFTTFDKIGIKQEFIDKIAQSNIKTPTAVQAQVIPDLLENESLIFQSETGTGKTLAYLLPLIQNIAEKENPRQAVKIVIVAPTIELASQIKAQVKIVSNVKTALLVGGAPLKRQMEMLKEKPTIIIGGAARILELVHLKKLKLDAAEAIVLDEVDRLLSPELRDDTLELVTQLSSNSQLIACSATITNATAKILGEAKDFDNPRADEPEKKSAKKIKTVFLPPEDVLRKRISHIAIFAENRDKIDTLRKIINAEHPEKTLVFTSKIDQVANIVSKLKYKNIECEGLHAKLDKVTRKSIIDRFRSGKLKMLVTSDLTSRGLDIPDITHIIQMDLPSDEDFFVHRAGRTARAGKTGTNIVIGDAYEMRKFVRLEKKLKITVYPKMLYKGQLVAPSELEENNTEDPSN